MTTGCAVITVAILGGIAALVLYLVGAGIWVALFG